MSLDKDKGPIGSVIPKRSEHSSIRESLTSASFRKRGEILQHLEIISTTYLVMLLTCKLFAL